MTFNVWFSFLNHQYVSLSLSPCLSLSHSLDSSCLALPCFVLPCAALPCLVFIMFLFSLSLLFPRLSFLQLVTKGQDIIVRVETPDTMRSGEASNPLRRTGKTLKRRESEVQKLNDLKCVIQFFESSICLPLSLSPCFSLSHSLVSSCIVLSCPVLPCVALPCLVFIKFLFSLSLLFPRLSLSIFVSISLMW